MEDISVPSLVIGGISGLLISFLVGYFFYVKSKVHIKLNPYLISCNSLFTHSNKELSDNLKLAFKNHSIENVAQIKMVVANEGNKPIMNLIEPLRIVLPEDNEILSIEILEINPNERKILHTVNRNKNHAQFDFELLNPQEYFIIKLTAKCSIDVPINTDGVKFTITGEYMPSVLYMKNLPDFYYDVDKNNLISFYGNRVIESLFILIGFLFYMLIVYGVIEDMFLSGFSWFGFVTGSMFLVFGGSTIYLFRDSFRKSKIKVPLKFKG
ncbi:hypothetical protein AB9P05_01485 [Roseivirga sp. BDSF3-8]|uniref:hypothetical protein n=1 Tax=Roseivirga sp. BDSF3-8 TaxID=3241598 RepID=UPI003531DEA7